MRGEFRRRDHRGGRGDDRRGRLHLRRRLGADAEGVADDETEARAQRHEHDDGDDSEHRPPRRRCHGFTLVAR